MSQQEDVDGGSRRSRRRRRGSDYVKLVYRGMSAYYTLVLVLLSLLAVVALVTGQVDIAVLVLALAGVPFTMRLLVRRFAARR